MDHDQLEVRFQGLAALSHLAPGAACSLLMPRISWCVNTPTLGLKLVQAEPGCLGAAGRLSHGSRPLTGPWHEGTVGEQLTRLHCRS